MSHCIEDKHVGAGVIVKETGEEGTVVEVRGQYVDVVFEGVLIETIHGSELKWL